MLTHFRPSGSLVIVSSLQCMRHDSGDLIVNSSVSASSEYWSALLHLTQTRPLTLDCSIISQYDLPWRDRCSVAQC